ncbi:hypothetical protein RND81_02G217400 [Saponaria officinalis]|uniref:Uncharacterized protein n=1 Tax=Saponaria officinalis TaxID=3572 RepID=A0AAW1MWT5_SAPOF
MKRPTNPMLMDFQITEDHILKGILQTARSRRQIKDNQVISSMWPDCLDCVEAAATKITKACKFWKEGIVWFEECTLRYANRTIFSIDEEDPYKLYYNDTGIVTEHQLDQYKQVFDTTMDALINQAAYSQGTLPGFATKQINLSTSGILEGLAQCTPDIVGRPCYRCLRTALRLRDTWANTVVFLPSCLIRYDLYETVLLSPPSQPPPPQQGLHIGIIVAVIIVVVLLIVLALIGGWFLLYKPRPQGDEDSVSGLQRLTSAQIDVLRMVRHSNVVSLLGYCQDPKTLALVCEYMDKGDLKDRLSGSCSLSWRQRLQIAIDTATGLAYLHDNCDYPIVHRDVKPANILLHEIDGELTAKVADFGYSKIFPAKDVTTLQTRIIGTCGYIAPD